MSIERTYYIYKGYLFQETENDGYTYMRRGPETSYKRLCTVEEAKKLYPFKLQHAIVLEHDRLRLPMHDG